MKLLWVTYDLETKFIIREFKIDEKRIIGSKD